MKRTAKRAVKRTTKKTSVVVDNGPALATPTHATRNTGIIPGYEMRVVAGQNRTFEHNAKWGLNDHQIAAMWSANWPMGDVGRNGYTPRPGEPANQKTHVAGARRDFNRGRHGNPVPPVEPLPQFVFDPATGNTTATVRQPRTT